MKNIIKKSNKVKSMSNICNNKFFAKESIHRNQSTTGTQDNQQKSEQTNHSILFAHSNC